MTIKAKSAVFALIILLSYSCTEDDFLKGYDRQALFAQPTQQEIDVVISDWQSRDLSPKDYHVEQTVKVMGSSTLKIISFRVSGNKEYAAVLVPDSDKPMPVRIYIGGFGIDIIENSVAMVQSNAQTGEPYIFALPALRGQSLSLVINGVEYTTPVSEGEHCEAFDGAADDAIALLNVIAANEIHADINRTSIRGGSRGSTVSMLVGERDKRIKGVVSVAGPENLLSLTAKSENDRTYQCQFLQNLVDGNSTLSEARHNLIASSPVFFAAALPRTQYHLAANDKIVPVSQGDELVEKMSQLGLSNKLEYYVYEGRDHSNIASSNEELNTRIEQFLSQVLK